MAKKDMKSRAGAVKKKSPWASSLAGSLGAAGMVAAAQISKEREPEPQMGILEQIYTELDGLYKEIRDSRLEASYFANEMDDIDDLLLGESGNKFASVRFETNKDRLQAIRALMKKAKAYDKLTTKKKNERKPRADGKSA